MPAIQTAVDSLFADPDVQRMLALSAKLEPLAICFPYEVGMTRFLRWLLDPSEGHGLSDLALKALLAKAGQTKRAKALPLAQRRFLAPSQVHTSSFSSVIVAAEVDIGVKERKCLDVLVIDVSGRVYVAVENKFGAREGKDQTKAYYDGLRKLFPDFDGYHIYVDWNDREPAHDQWLKVGYDWLEVFLRSAEQRESTSAQVRATLAQFRRAIALEDESSAESSNLGTLVTQIASRHSQALESMKTTVRPHGSGEQRARELAQLLKMAGEESKLVLRLFQLYSRRPEIWDRCFSVNQKFMAFVDKLSSSFGEVRVEPQKVRAHFSLADWDRFVKDPSSRHFWAAVVSVRQMEDRWRVQSYLQLASVKAEKKDKLLEVAGALRKKYGINKSTDLDQNYVLLRKTEELTTTQAIEMLDEQMRVLKKELDAAI